MFVYRCTITGADDNVDPEKLQEISKKFPFVEWGILVSKKSEGKPRYPTRHWVMGPKIRLFKNVSFHLCGKTMRDFITDPTEINLPTPNHVKARHQLNFNAGNEKFTAEQIFKASRISKVNKFILQSNVANKSLIENLMKTHPVYNFDILHDSSGGRGVYSDDIPVPYIGYKNGYCGGITPDNIKEYLKAADASVHQGRIWIDVESGVRSNDEFDLKKVVEILEQVKQFNALGLSN